VSGFSITQTEGEACSRPSVVGALPFAVGDIAGGSSATAPVTLNFGNCGGSAKFSVEIGLSGNGGNATGVLSVTGQAP